MRFILDPLFRRHDAGAGHPESPRRLGAVDLALERAGLGADAALQARDATVAELRAVHSEDMVQAVLAAAGRHVRFDPDTSASPDSSAAAVRAAGALNTAIEHCHQSAAPVFAFPRPPGHHAESDRIMGFCLLNNVAVGAAFAIEALGCQRVAVLDWDVHHGNGTQEIFYGRSDVLYLSSHQFPFYPGTGHPREVGRDAGEGYTVNVPMPAGATDAEMAAAMAEIFLPVLRAYEPELLIVSAGFDAHARDPLAQLAWSTEGYAWCAAQLQSLADELCGGRWVMALEGGYDVDALSESVGVCLEVLAGARRVEALAPGPPAEDYAELLAAVRGQLRPYWSSL